MEKIIGLVIIVLVVIAFISSIIRIYNKLVFLNFNVDKTFANIDVLLKQRADEIPNIIKIINENVSYESKILEKLTELRTKYLNTTNQNEKVDTSNSMANELGKIMVISENYPNLKANKSFERLQKRVSELENHIADRRELFNESVNLYNVGINEFPAILITKTIGYQEKLLLQISKDEIAYDGIKF